MSTRGTETEILEAIYKALEAKRRLLGKSPDPAKPGFDPEEERDAYKRLDSIFNIASKEQLALINEVLRILAATTLSALLGRREKAE
jgi:hypothetical protein